MQHEPGDNHHPRINHQEERSAEAPPPRQPINKALRHFNLCGEFCVSALLGTNMIPLLQQWKGVYVGANKILNNNVGTSIYDLNTMLKMCEKQGEEYRYSPSITSISPQRLKDRLSSGQMAIIGVVISNRGRLDLRGTIAHWMVMEDVIPVGYNGWIRVYNPFVNREEVYPYDLFMQSMAKFPFGLWVADPPGKL